MKCSCLLFVAVIFISQLFFFSLASSSSSPSSHLRAKRNAFDILIKKKGLGAAAAALFAVKAIRHKKFVPVPIPFPLPILKPPIIQPIPVFGKLGLKAGLTGGLGGIGGLGGGLGGIGGGGFGYGR